MWHIVAAKAQGIQGETIRQWLDIFSKLPHANDAWSQKNAEGKTTVEVAAEARNLAMMSVLFAPFQETISLEFAPLGNVVGTLLDHFTKEGVYPGEEGARIGLMMYFIAATCPGLIQGADYEKARKMMAQEVNIPPEVVVCLKTPFSISGIVRDAEYQAKREVCSYIHSYKGLLEAVIKSTNPTIEEEARAYVLEQLTPHHLRERPPLQDPQPTVQALAKEWNDAGYDIINPKTAKELLVPDPIGQSLRKNQTPQERQKGLTPIHYAILSGNVSFIDAVCGPERRYQNVLTDWDNPALHAKQSLLDFAISEYTHPLTSNEKKRAIKEIVTMLVAAHPALTKKITQPIPEGLAIIQNPGMARILGMIQKSRAAYLQECKQFFLPPKRPL